MQYRLTLEALFEQPEDDALSMSEMASWERVLAEDSDALADLLIRDDVVCSSLMIEEA